MKKLILSSLFSILYVSCVFAQQNDTSSISKAHWLIGTWKGIHKGEPFFETWRKKNDSSLICYSISMKNGDTTVKENSAIEFENNVVVFRDPNVWKAKRIVDNEMTFELSNERGLSRIIWMKKKDNHWWALLQFPKATHYYDLEYLPELDKAVNKFIFSMKK